MAKKVHRRVGPKKRKVALRKQTRGAKKRTESAPTGLPGAQLVTVHRPPEDENYKPRTTVFTIERPPEDEDRKSPAMVFTVVRESANEPPKPPPPIEVRPGRKKTRCEESNTAETKPKAGKSRTRTRRKKRRS